MIRIRIRSRDPIRDQDAVLKNQAAQAVNRNISARYYIRTCIDTDQSDMCAPYNSGDRLDVRKSVDGAS